MATEAQTPTCPMSADKVIETYFLEHRGKLIDIAAFLDRIDRAQASDTSASDFRLEALIRGLQLVGDGKPDRARRLLEMLSDPSTEPIPEAHTKSASGANPPTSGGAS